MFLMTVSFFPITDPALLEYDAVLGYDLCIIKCLGRASVGGDSRKLEFDELERLGRCLIEESRGLIVIGLRISVGSHFSGVTDSTDSRFSGITDSHSGELLNSESATEVLGLGRWLCLLVVAPSVSRSSPELITSANSCSQSWHSSSHLSRSS
jgi:hypothetical protein